MINLVPIANPKLDPTNKSSHQYGKLHEVRYPAFEKINIVPHMTKCTNTISFFVLKSIPWFCKYPLENHNQ